jgi:hypothetical protein
MCRRRRPAHVTRRIFSVYCFFRWDAGAAGWTRVGGKFADRNKKKLRRPVYHNKWFFWWYRRVHTCCSSSFINPHHRRPHHARRSFIYMSGSFRVCHVGLTWRIIQTCDPLIPGKFVN